VASEKISINQANGSPINISKRRKVNQKQFHDKDVWEVTLIYLSSIFVEW
jgi:hypothetical protein